MMHEHPPDVCAGRLLDYRECLPSAPDSGRSFEQSKGIDGCSREDCVCESHLRSQPFRPTDSSSLHGYGLRLCGLIQMRHKLWASLKKSENHDARVGFVIEEYERSVKEGGGASPPLS